VYNKFTPQKIQYLSTSATLIFVAHKPRAFLISCLSTLTIPGAIANAGYHTSASVVKLNLAKSHVTTAATTTATTIAAIHVEHHAIQAAPHVAHATTTAAMTTAAITTAAPAHFRNGASGLKAESLLTNRLL